ncbi:UPF0716 protein FxsA [Oceanospirillum multiglobuliferum]|uniref:Exlusion protein FxsA n=1 Tax=Oceanospirillum multiglobuliferum TaxID=64969 RepID=A0A1T4KN87_9GAMM|nr:FxsA family protein [Oceanospirillum multiglobuliferum]OPX56081.1 hypothetical protein BTE48_05910 [Oceanospirillum multiglobuliferum]SJZ43865.1 UPF0716 protein FxsA [Oceanospirillum multiglobuliferum]
MNKLLLLFIAVPLVEMVVLIKVGEQIGALSTIALVILTAAIGIHLLKKQGVAMLNQANWKINQGQIPAKEMAEGIVLAIGGALLLTPGFVTDAIGFACLIPISRHFLLGAVLKNINVSPIYTHNSKTSFHQPPEQSKNIDPQVLEGEFERKK